MDDTEDDPRNTHNRSSDQQKAAVGNVVDFARNANGDEDDEDDDDVDVDIDDEEDDEDENGVHRIAIVEYRENDNEEDEQDEEDDGNIERHPKKRKLKSLLSSYELAPRLPEASASSTKFSGRNSVGDWSEHETLILLGAWGDKYLQHRRKSLRSDEWQEVADKVSQGSKIVRTDSQCRNRLDTLKKKYKKEKAKMTENGSYTSKWIYFNRMDSLISSSPLQAVVACDPDSREYKEDYNNRVNGLDEIRDSSPGNLNSEEEDSGGASSNKIKNRKDSFKLLANCVLKFSKIYEKVEFKKRQQMLEIEKMRMDFLKDIESQRKQIIQRAQAEIARIRQGDSEEKDASAVNNIGSLGSH